MPHRCSGNTSLALRAAAARHAGCAGRRNCNVNLDDLDQDRPDLNCEPLQAPGTVRNLQLDETTWAITDVPPRDQPPVGPPPIHATNSSTRRRRTAPQAQSTRTPISKLVVSK